jgi:hypothetical protein
MFTGLSILPVGIWAAITAVYNDVNCWAADSTNYGYVVDGPRILTLVVSLCKMVHITLQHDLHLDLKAICACGGAHILEAPVLGHLTTFLKAYTISLRNLPDTSTVERLRSFDETCS